MAPGAPEREKGPFYLHGKKVVRKGLQEDVKFTRREGTGQLLAQAPVQAKSV